MPQKLYWRPKKEPRRQTKAQKMRIVLQKKQIHQQESMKPSRLYQVSKFQLKLEVQVEVIVVVAVAVPLVTVAVTLAKPLEMTI